jgi:hypothetical protein
MAEYRDFHPDWIVAKPADMLPPDWDRLTEAYWIYTSQYLRHTIITRQFLHPLNVAFIVSMLNRAMSQKTNTRFSCTEYYTGELAQDMADVAFGNSSYANTNNEPFRTKVAIDDLTQKFIDKWITNISMGWLEQGIFNQWALENNRIQYFPYPIQEEHTLHNWAIEVGDYMLSSPFSNANKDFLLRYNQPQCLNGQQDTTSPAYFFNQAGV